MKKCTVIIF